MRNELEKGLNAAANGVDNMIALGQQLSKDSRRLIARSALSLVLMAAPAAALAPSSARSAEASPANQTQQIGKGECITAVAPGLAVGDLHVGSNDGKRLYLYPQTGNFGNMTRINETVTLCGGENGGKYRPNADAAYEAEQVRVMMEAGCQSNTGCDGVRKWSWPEAKPEGREGCVNNTDLTSGEAISEGVRDWLICRTPGQEKEVNLAEWCRVMGDGKIKVGNRIVWVNDSDKNTGQIAIIHTTEPTRFVSEWEADVECVGAPLDMAAADARTEENIADMRAQNKSGVNVVHVFPGGGTTVTRR